MKTPLALALAAVALVGGWTIHASLRQDPSPAQDPVSSEKATYVEVIPGVSRSVLWGDPAKGPYGAFTKMEPGFQKERHSHSSDIRMVVLKGAYICKTDAGEIRVEKGSYFLLPANLPHETAADEKEGALFYEESPGKFDLNPSK